MPPNASALDRAAASVAVKAIDAIPLPHRALWNPATCPPELLPWLAWAVGVEGWRRDWSEDIKRGRVRSAIDIQRAKGTLYAVRKVVESFGGQIGIREWWQQTPKGTPHTFELVLTLGDSGGLESSAHFVEDVIGEVTRAKPLRSHFIFVQGLNVKGCAKAVAVAGPVAFARLNLAVE